MKWLIGCFEPFDRAETNSSEIVWRHLRALDWNGQARFAGPLPVSFKRAWPELERQAGDSQGILVFGQAVGRPNISLECIALNWIDARIADNDNDQPRLTPVLSQRPDVLWSQIPWARFGENETWRRSYSAGTFVCNHVMYHSVNWANNHGRLGGFVHVPLLESQPDAQYSGLVKMPDGTALPAAEAIVKFLIELKE